LPAARKWAQAGASRDIFFVACNLFACLVRDGGEKLNLDKETKMAEKIVAIGGGLAGLTAANFLARAGRE